MWHTLGISATTGSSTLGGSTIGSGTRFCIIKSFSEGLAAAGFESVSNFWEAASNSANNLKMRYIVIDRFSN